MDTSNRFVVTMNPTTERLAILNIAAFAKPPHDRGLTVDDALNLAAWLVAVSTVAENGGRENFLRVLDAIEAT